jgi:glycosyltransferase involved in cell wall biosynthesis
MKKTILFLAYDLPYPLDAGGKIRAYHLIRQLSKSYAVRLIYFYRGVRNKDNERYLKPFCEKIISFKRRSLLSTTTIRYLATLPFPAALYYDKTVEKTIDKEIDAGIDVLHAESFYTSMYIKNGRKIPQLLGTENIEWHVYKEYSNQNKNPILKTLYTMETERIKKYEIQTWNTVDTVLAVSQENIHKIQQYTNKPVIEIKNGVDIDYFNKIKKNNSSKTILFVGNFNYIQNLDAADYLLRTIVPLISGDFTIRLVGKDPSNDLVRSVKNTNQHCVCKVQLDENVEDIRTAYGNAYVMIAPLRSGSGTKFKVLEAMASGLPVVTTAIGAEGLSVQNNKNIIIREAPEELADAVQSLFNEKTLYTALVNGGKSVVKNHYSWEAIGKNLREAYEKTFDHYR